MPWRWLLKVMKSISSEDFEQAARFARCLGSGVQSVGRALVLPRFLDSRPPRTACRLATWKEIREKGAQ